MVMKHESLVSRREGRLRLPRGRRCATTLVEVMVVVAVATMVMGVVISVMISLRQWDRRLREGNLHAEQTLRLAERMRSDIRRAIGVSARSKEVVTVEFADNSQARYELAPEGCLRTVTAAGGAESSRDLFSVGPATDWLVETGPTGKRGAIVVTLKRDEIEDAHNHFAPLLVFAALGADLRPLPPPANESNNPEP